MFFIFHAVLTIQLHTTQMLYVPKPGSPVINAYIHSQIAYPKRDAHMNIMIYRNIINLASMVLVSLVLTNFPAAAQSGQIASGSAQGPGYVTLADYSSEAPIVAQVRVKRVIDVPAERAPNLEPGKARLYIEADIVSLIRGRGGLSESIRYLVDVNRDSRGKVAKYKKRNFLIFAKPVSGRPGEVQLIESEAHIPWTPELDANVRSVLREIVSADAPPDIIGIREALHVAGNLEGEGETQIFLRTANDAPVSISVLRRPGLRPQWAVSLSEIVDEAASAPRRNTLLWYKLACFLPDTLPRESLLSSSRRANDLAEADYQFVRQQLGPCPR